jgi:cytidine deaminase
MNSNLRDLAEKASRKAHSPYSKVQVGAALETIEGQFFTGCNVENSSYGGTICGERTAIVKAVSEGHKNFKHIYVYTKDGWPPCGLCLQVMAEFSTGELLVTLGDEKGNEVTKQLKDFLPHAFTPKHLK